MEYPTTAEPDTLTVPLRKENTTPTAAPKPPAAKPEAAKPEAAPVEAAPAACPRCGGRLMNPDSLGWCPKCGYCKSLEEDAARVPKSSGPAVKKTSPLGIAEFYDLLCRLPRWLWVLLGGAVAVAVVSVAGHLLLPPDGLARALWSSIQLVLGVLVVFAAQVWALVLIAPHDDHLGPKDLVISARLWALTLRRLPDLRRQVWLGGWGVTLMACALFVVGGLSFWFQYYKPKKLANKNLLAAVVAAAAKGGDPNKSMEEAVADLANIQDLTKKDKEDTKPKEDKRPGEDCVIIGYTVEGEVVSSLLVATLANDKLRYAGAVKQGFTPEASAELLKRLAPLVRKQPLLPSLKMDAIWVKPEVFCAVRHSGYDEQGRFQKPSFAALLNVK